MPNELEEISGDKLFFGDDASQTIPQTSDVVAATSLHSISESLENLIECVAEADDTDAEKDHTLISVLRSIDATLKEMVELAKKNM